MYYVKFRIRVTGGLYYSLSTVWMLWMSSEKLYNLSKDQEWKEREKFL